MEAGYTIDYGCEWSRENIQCWNDPEDNVVVFTNWAENESLYQSEIFNLTAIFRIKRRYTTDNPNPYFKSNT